MFQLSLGGVSTLSYLNPNYGRPIESNAMKMITRTEDIYRSIKLTENNRDLFPPMRFGSRSLGTTRDFRQAFCRRCANSTGGGTSLPYRESVEFARRLVSLFSLYKGYLKK